MKSVIMMALAVVLAVGCDKVLQKVAPQAVPAAEARIMVRDPYRETTVGSRPREDESFIRTECEIIQSMSVLKAVVTNLKLQEAWGTNGQPMPMDQACGVLISSLTVQSYRDTQLISIRVARPDPEEAARIANETAAVFRDRRVSSQRQSLQRAIDVIENESTKQRDKVAAAEAKCDELRKSLGINVLAVTDESRIPQLRMDQAAAHVEADALKSRLDKMQDLSDEEMATLASIMLNDDSASVIYKRIVEIQIGAVPAGTSVTAEDLKAELATAVARIRKALRSQYAVAAEKARVLDAELEAFANRDEKSIAPYRAALRDLEIQRQILDALRARIAQAGIEVEIPRSEVDIVDPAEPSRPGQSR